MRNGRILRLAVVTITSLFIFGAWGTEILALSPEGKAGAKANNPPIATGKIDDITLPEDKGGETPDITALFADVDDPPANLTYSLRVISQDTHPPGSSLPMSYDARYYLFKMGPAHLFYGYYLLELNCTDNHPGTVPATIRFNLTIVHMNHSPRVKEDVMDPMELTLKEHQKDDHLLVANLFTDWDLPEAYANDALSFNVTGYQKLLVSINDDDYLVIDTGKDQYIPNLRYDEKLTVTCRDKAGAKTTLNITVTIEPVDDPPAIITFQPEELELTLMEGQNGTFRVTAADNDTAKLTFGWFVDGKKEDGQVGTVFYFHPDFTMGGAVHTVKVVVSDGTTSISIEWKVHVLDIQPEQLEPTLMEDQTGTFKVTADENYSAKLTFGWFVDGKNENGQVGTVFYFHPDFTMGGAVHTVKVVVSDGTTNISIEWNVHVLNVNRLPSVIIESPANFTKFKKGTVVDFLANASDPDGDQLTFTWRDENGTKLGKGPSFSTPGLKSGTHIIRVEVNDTKASVFQEVTVIIPNPSPSSSPKGFIPGFEAILALAACGTGTFLMAGWRSRRKA